MPKVSDTHKRLLIICGSTATGKTKLAVTLAKKYNGELVSADSRQVYRGIDVISGKDIQELSGIPIWLYDIASVDEQFSVSLYKKRVTQVITDILARGKLPIVVGGTGLYIASIIDPPETIHIPPNPSERLRWDRCTVKDLQKELRKKDANRLDRMNHSDCQNPRRLIRALEIAAWNKNYTPYKVEKDIFNVYWIGLRRSNDQIRSLIEKRVNDRWQNGALEEVTSLSKLRGMLPAISAFGIEQITDFLEGRITESEAKIRWVREEVSYAKRQMTWFNKYKEIRWYDAGDADCRHTIEQDVASWYT